MDELTTEFRRRQVVLRALTVRELRRLWPALDPDRLDDTFFAWFSAVAPLVTDQRRLSVMLAWRYVQAVRAAAGVPGGAPVPVVPDLPAAVLMSSMAVTGPVAIKKAMARGEKVEKASVSAFTLSAGAVTRHILDAGRQAVTSSIEQDDRAVGWRRVTSPKACEFCDSLDDIYPPGYGDFKSHDHCMCSAEPAYK